MTIDEINRKGEISPRSYNICKFNNLNSVKDLKNYFFKYKSFKFLPNCGRKSIEELIEICNIYKSSNFDASLSASSRIQRELINIFIIEKTNELSTRSRKFILFYLNNNLRIENFSDKILNNKDFMRTDNVRTRRFNEIEVYISIIKDKLTEISQRNDENSLNFLKKINLLAQRTLSISEIPYAILEKESIFLLIDFLLDQCFFLSPIQTDIFTNCLKIYQNKKVLPIDYLAEAFELSEGRVTKIRNDSQHELFDKLLYIENFNEDLFEKYNLDITSNYIDIGMSVVDSINTTNNTNFSREFITCILSAYLNNNFTLIGNYEDVLQVTHFNTLKRHYWKNFYLINKKSVYEIDFNALVKDIYDRINDRIKESYSFNFKSYLSRFLTNNNFEILDSVFSIGEKIINDEFELYLDLDDLIIFKRNTNKQVYEYTYEALEQLDKPSKVKEIFEKVIELYPNYDTEESKIRTSMKRKNGFVPFGRTSVFGLKKWEDCKENIKGGTIKDIITEYLENSNTPLHITEILEEVHKYRGKTNEKNIITNLKLDPSNSFLFFNQNFIGLLSKKNKYDLIKYENLPLQLGNNIINKHKKGSSIDDIKVYLKKTFDLSFEESELIILNLKYFIDNKIIRAKTSSQLPML